MEKLPRVDPATAFVRRLGGDVFMLREAADLLGIGARTLRALLKSGQADYQPSHIAHMGQVRIYLFTREDIERIREVLNGRYSVQANEGKPLMGRPAIYTKEERVLRQRQYSMAHYYRRRYEELLAAGKEDKAAAALAKAHEYEALLKGPTDDGKR